MEAPSIGQVAPPAKPGWEVAAVHRVANPLGVPWSVRASGSTEAVRDGFGTGSGFEVQYAYATKPMISTKPTTKPNQSEGGSGGLLLPRSFILSC